MSLIEAAAAGRGCQAEVLFELGIKYASGGPGLPDLVAAHKWFNLAAMQGKREAARYRCEIASEMSDDEIAAAQRAARAWIQASAVG